MAKIAIDRAPPTTLPRRFLLSSPLWLAAAGLLLLHDGDAALQSRWAPATLALVHALTLGAWGNAMFGSLLQFLPAAAGVRVRGGARAGQALHALLNAGALLLVAGLHALSPRLLLPAAVLLGAAFALLAATLLPGLWSRAQALPLLRTGLRLAVAAGVVTAALGIAMAWSLLGHRGLPAVPWIDVHAAWGALGWMLGLLASVGGVTLPMFQGTRPLPPRAQGAWLAGVALVLVAGGCLAGVHGDPRVLRFGAAVLGAVFALAGLAWQWRARHARNPWLVRSWRLGFLAVLAAAGVLACGGPSLAVGTLLLGVAMPGFIGGMQLEILAFLGWIELTRRCPRGVRLPPVQRLLPEAGKARVFALQAASAALLLAALRWPLLARGAGLGLGAHALLLWWTLQGVQRRVRDFADAHVGAPPRRVAPGQHTG